MRLEVEGLGVELEGASILDEVSFCAEGGELIGILGPNGAGKSTLLRACCGLVKPSRGRVLLDGRSVHSMSPRDRARKVSYLAQREELLQGFSVLDYVLLGRTMWAGHLGPISCGDLEAARGSLARVGAEGLAQREMSSLSGGELSMVRLARSIASGSDVLMLDEPVSHLDVRYALKAMEVLKGLSEEGKLVLVVLHDLNLAMRFCSRVLLLLKGTLLLDGPPGALSPELVDRAFGVKPSEVFVGERRLLVF